MLPLKVLCVGLTHDYGNPDQGSSYEYMNFHDTLLRLGCTVLTFDTGTAIRQHGRARFNERLREVVNEEKPDVLFCMMYKHEIDPEVMRRITEETDTLTLNWFYDDVFRFDGYSRHFATCFDWILTVDPFAVEKYKALGAKNVSYEKWGCNPFLYHPTQGELLYDVTFVGQPHGKRREAIAALERAGVNVQTWGKGWKNGRLSQEGMVEVFGRSRINLNFSEASARPGLRGILGFTLPKQVKARMLEVPSCGGFLLTGDAPLLSEYYEAGKEVAVFRSLSDLVEKVQYYLSHEDERAAIARAGYERTMREHTYPRRLEQLFQKIGFSVPSAEDVLAGKVPLGTDTEVKITSATPVVSVVMPVYNGERHLRESIESILTQTFTDLELIIVDDGSTKPLTLSILEEMVPKDVRIRLLRQENQGKGPARSAGSRAARGTYVAIMDQDDIAVPERLTTQVNYLDAHPHIGAVGSWAEVIDDDGQDRGALQHPTLPASVCWSMAVKNPIVNSTGMVRRILGEQMGWYRDLAAEDYDFWARAAQAFPVANLPSILLKYRKWEGAYTTSSIEKLHTSSMPIMRSAAESLLGHEVDEGDVAALRRVTAGAEILSVDECRRANDLLWQLWRAFHSRANLSSGERRFIRDCTAEWLCYLSGRVRPQALLLALSLLLRAFFLSPFWTVQALAKRPRSLLHSERIRPTLRGGIRRVRRIVM